MEKFNSQQDALRTALNQVLGFAPSKGNTNITVEQREEVGKLMMGWLKEGRWSIRPGTRAFSNPLNYIIGKQPTCLIEAYVQPKAKKNEPTTTAAAANPAADKFALIKQAVECGILSKEEGTKQFLALLNEK